MSELPSQHLLDTLTHEWQSFSRMVLTIAGTFFGLSVTFAQDIAGPEPESVWRLSWGWGFLVLALVTVLVSHYTAALSHQRHYESDLGKAEAQKLEMADEDAAVHWDAAEEYERKSNRWDAWTQVANFVALVAVPLGLGLVSWFAITNLGNQ